jgi:hypothetical protein
MAAAKAITITEVDFVFDVSVEVVLVVGVVAVVSVSTGPSVRGLPPPSPAAVASGAVMPARAKTSTRHSKQTPRRDVGARRLDIGRAYLLEARTLR